MNKSSGIVYVVDDDDAVREGLRWLFSSVDREVADYPGIAPFLAAYVPERPGCLLLDVRMPGGSGLDLLDDLAARDVPLPVIILSGHGDIPMAVRATQRGALDFVTKPGNEQAILDRVEQALAGNAECLLSRRLRAEVDRRFQQLSKREVEVIRMVATGHFNKEVGDKLNISERTVETHRLHALRKLNTRAGADLYKLVSILDGPACPFQQGKICPACRAVG
jgi:FixJ family two-component response regulator